jgi:hypothetical protein
LEKVKMSNFNLPARTLPTGDTTFGPFSVPVNTALIAMTLDVTSMEPGVVDANGNLISGQRVWVLLEYWDGLLWTGAKADFTGPWRDRQGVLHNDVTLRFDFGTKFVNGAWVANRSASGWQARVTFTVENGPYDTAGGTLALT